MGVSGFGYKASNSPRDARTLVDGIFPPAAAIEFKRLKMIRGPLFQLDGTMIEVEFAVEGGLRSVKGRGEYSFSDPDFGKVLIIHVTDPEGDFEFVLPESTWKGRPEPSNVPDCAFRICLAGYRDSPKKTDIA